MDELDKAIKALNKKFGGNYITRGTQVLDNDYKRNSTGIFALDFATGGGIPERKVVMIAGKESSGKTSSGITTTAEVQKKGGKVAWVDTEHSLDPIWAAKFGVNFEELIVAQANTIEEASDTIETLILTGELDLIVFDSLAATASKAELEASAEQKSMGGNAKAIGLMMRKITARLNDNENPVKTSVLLINQLRENVAGWGAPEYLPGGRQLLYQTDIIVWLRPDSEPVGGKENPQGIRVKFKVTKNRTFPPLKIGHYDLLFEGRIDNNKSIAESAVIFGIVKKAGPWYSFGEFKASGLDNFMDTIKPKMLDSIKEQVVKVMTKPPKELKPLEEPKPDELKMEVK